MTVENIKQDEKTNDSQEVILLKAEAFDLMVHRDRVNKEVQARLNGIYERLNELSS